MNQNKKIAIVADWLIDFGWAEVVLSHLLELYPEADIYTSVCYMDHPMLEGRNVYTSWLQKVPYFNRRHKLAGFLRPFAFRSFDLSSYDIIICSSSAESKQVAVRRTRAKILDIGRSAEVISAIKKQVIFCYCHTPIRYYWSHHEEYLNMLEFGILNRPLRYIFAKLIPYLRDLDREWALHIDYFIANSKNTHDRIARYYHRNSHIIHPGTEPIPEPENSKPKHRFIDPEKYYITIGRAVPYKRFDLLVDTFNKNGKKLIICTSTDTPTYRALRSRSHSNIEWQFGIDNGTKYELLCDAQAFLFPGEEDFGIAPIEAMSVGTPVIAYAKWWALETVRDGITGVFFHHQSVHSLNEAIEKRESMIFENERIIEHAVQFSKEAFQKNIQEFISKNA